MLVRLDAAMNENYGVDELTDDPQATVGALYQRLTSIVKFLKQIFRDEMKTV